MNCVVQSLQVSTFTVHTCMCITVCMYVCAHASNSVSKYYHASMYMCFGTISTCFLLSFMQLSWEYMHAHANVPNVPTCSCTFIGTSIHECTHTSYDRLYYFVIRNNMLKQYAIARSVLVVMLLTFLVVLTKADCRVLCLVFRKLPQLRILHSTACIICTTNSFFVCEIGIFSVFQLYLLASALSAEWIVHMQNSHNNYRLLIENVVSTSSI